MDKLELLRDYVQNAEPQINQELRVGKDCPNAVIFDSLFVSGEVPDTLYRLVPNSIINFDNDGIFLDPAYLSCTDDVDKFLGGISSNDIACMIINVPSPFQRIVVNEVLPDYNDEGEYILPRNLGLRKTDHQQYTGLNGFMNFIEKVGSSESAKTLLDIYHIERIDLYEFVLAYNKVRHELNGEFL